MKAQVAKAALASLCALVATQAFAQEKAGAHAVPASAKAKSLKADAKASTKLAAVGNLRAAKPAAATTAAASGQIIVLADGIVANATHAQVHAPAAGFVYEQ